MPGDDTEVEITSVMLQSGVAAMTQLNAFDSENSIVTLEEVVTAVIRAALRTPTVDEVGEPLPEPV